MPNASAMNGARMSEPAAHYDIAVIGGGINGAGIARDAAGRGAKVVLFERGDLAQGTSSASTKLIHGGLRYLEHYEFGLVREALKERETLWGIAPHIIHPMRFVLPYVPGLRPRWLLRAGLFLYDHLGGRKRLPATRSIRLGAHPAGVPLAAGFDHGFEYSDGWVDDARLVVLNARDAADKGADIRTRCTVVATQRVGDCWRIDTQSADGSRASVHAAAVVNAAGPGVAAVAHLSPAGPDRVVRLVRGSHIVVPKLFDHSFAYFFQLADNRIFFAIPYERDFTLIGTTDRDHDPAAEKVAASDEEVAYLCSGASGFFNRPVTPDMVVWSYAGVRPLVDDGKGRPEAASRGYQLAVDRGAGNDAPLLTVYGGKITTYRHLAESAVGLLTPLLPALTGAAWTAHAALPGGDFAIDGLAALMADLAARYPFLDAATVDRMARAYGTTAFAILGAAPDRAALGHDFGHGLREAEVRHLVTREWARSADDIVWRRTKLGLRFDAAEVAALQAWLDSGALRA